MTSSKRWAPTIEELRIAYCRQLDPLIPERAKVALINYPNHSNVGDSAIWLGELEYLSVRQAEVVYVSDLVSHNSDVMKSKIGDDGIILLHGGGNFGDLWPVHQRFREKILNDFPKNQIVVLPQTINFQNDASYVSALMLFGNHPKVTIVTRDNKSLAKAKELVGERTVLAPDSAIWLTLSCPEAVWRSQRVVWLSRTDHERVVLDGGMISGSPDHLGKRDWLRGASSQESGIAKLRVFALQRISGAMGRGGSLPRPVLGPLQRSLFRPVAEGNVARGVHFLGAGRVVVTDRLHGHLMCLLLGIPHALLADSHGKILDYFSTWYSPSLEGAIWCESEDEVASAVQRLDRLIEVD